MGAVPPMVSVHLRPGRLELVREIDGSVLAQSAAELMREKRVVALALLDETTLMVVQRH